MVSKSSSIDSSSAVPSSTPSPPPPPLDLPRVLVLDFYDSYTNNLLTLFGHYPDEILLKKVVIIKQDQFDWDFFRLSLLPSIDCILLSPGPGRPDRTEDFGFCAQLIRECPADFPILGICLGHQGIATSLGGKVSFVPEILHGQKTRISHNGKGLFKGVPQGVEMVTYNSLTVERKSLPEELEVVAWMTDDEETVMGLAHKERSVFGVQFHPESIHSSHGSLIVRNFLSTVVSSFPPDHEPASTLLLPPWLVEASSVRPSSTAHAHATTSTINPSSVLTSTPSPPQKTWKLEVHRFGQVGKGVAVQSVFEKEFWGKEGGEVWLDSAKKDPALPTYSYLSTPSHLLTYSLFPTPSLSLYPFSQPSSSSPIALPLPPSPISSPTTSFSNTETFFSLLNSLQLHLQAHTDLSPSSLCKADWKAGWVGWFGFEMKEETLLGYERPEALKDLPDGEKEAKTKDSCFAYTERVLVYEHETGEWVGMALVEVESQAEAKFGAGGEEGVAPSSLAGMLSKEGVRFGVSREEWKSWIGRTAEVLVELSSPSTSTTSASLPTPEITPFVPDQAGVVYSSLIDEARSAIHEGESYELTLTTQFRSSLTPTSPPHHTTHPSISSPLNPHSSHPDPNSTISTSIPRDLYALYKKLRLSNPAPYSSFISFPVLGTAVVSSSPERFIKIGKGGEVEMKPIKGTIGRCLEDAEEDERRRKGLEGDRKEIAENLMIVDLIRADLLSFCLPSSVKVPKLIQVETYDFVHTLVTTVVGQLGEGVGAVEAIGRCFPPGSMTGAPKLRSVQILDELEGHRPRGIYSGALGYLSFDGAADFSVTIRSIVAQGTDLSLGAGGAITWLSSREREWEEVLVKVGSVTKGLFP
ncbi:ADC synthase [Mrakia frigida]|uniref:ADC synthase n=1 Tax=Mrakia frigida TaxID=29902 RepID=UPI003FCBF196